MTISHEIEIAATPVALYEKLTSIPGIAAWCTPTTKGDAGKGGVLELAFGTLPVGVGKPLSLAVFVDVLRHRRLLTTSASPTPQPRRN